MRHYASVLFLNKPVLYLGRGSMYDDYEPAIDWLDDAHLVNPCLAALHTAYLPALSAATIRRPYLPAIPTGGDIACAPAHPGGVPICPRTISRCTQRCGQKRAMSCANAARAAALLSRLKLQT